MKIVTFVPAIHYEHLLKWWKHYDFVQVGLDHLSQNGLVVLSETNEPVCAGFVYRTDSAFYLLEFVVGNPEVEAKIRSAGLDLLISAAIILARALGGKTLFSAFGHKGLVEKTKLQGFSVLGTDVTNLIKEL